MKPLTKAMANHLRAVADYYGCNLVLEVSSTGIMLKANKGTRVLGSGAVSRQTEISFWVDANETQVEALTTRALQALP